MLAVPEFLHDVRDERLLRPCGFGGELGLHDDEDVLCIELVGLRICEDVEQTLLAILQCWQLRTVATRNAVRDSEFAVSTYDDRVQAVRNIAI